MALRSYKPITPGLRQLIQVDRSELWKGKPVKSLTEGLTKTGGRNNKGRITTRHIGGGHARRYRLVDFKRRKFDMEAKIERLEYDPNRTAFLALITYKDGTQSYILAPQRSKAGDIVVAGAKVDVKPGNAMLIKNIPVGTVVHNVEMKPGKGGQLARSAGSYAQLVAKEGDYGHVRLPSGGVRLVNLSCMATIGQVGNIDHENVTTGKAGKSRWLGTRPTVRGTAMNPVDHPMGGGEGRSKGGRHPCSPWGQLAKGKKTRKNKRTDKFIIKLRG